MGPIRGGQCGAGEIEERHADMRQIQIGTGTRGSRWRTQLKRRDHNGRYQEQHGRCLRLPAITANGAQAFREDGDGVKLCD